MGSSSSCADEHAKFTNSRCQCSGNGRSRVHRVEWVAVPMSYGIAYGATQVLRWVLLIPSFGTSVLKTKDLTHECVSIFFTCDVCGCTARWICEFSSQGKSFPKGYYSIEREIIKSFSEKSGFLRPNFADLDDNEIRSACLTLTDVQECFDSISPGSYNVLTNNCRDFAKRLYKKLSRRQFTKNASSFVSISFLRTLKMLELKIKP